MHRSLAHILYPIRAIMSLMKKHVGMLILLALLLIAVQPVWAITVDGDLSDWGLSALSGPASDWSQEATWLPANGVSYIIEDNNDPLQIGLPGYYHDGVHIKGSSSIYQPYKENPLKLKSGPIVASPFGGESYDNQAIYMTQDPTTIYIAVVTSTAQAGNPPGGHDSQPGDLGFNFGPASGEEYELEYGVKLGTQNSVGNYLPGTIVYLPDWQELGYVTPPTADVMKSPALPGGNDNAGSAQIAYTESWINHDDFGYPNYVIELAIPKSALGNPGNIGLNQIHLTQNCQNDHIFIPEFPSIAVSLGAIIGLVVIVFSIKNKE